MEAGEGGKEEGMTGGKVVPVALINASRERRREEEDQREASGLTEKRH